MGLFDADKNAAGAGSVQYEMKRAQRNNLRDVVVCLVIVAVVLVLRLRFGGPVISVSPEENGLLVVAADGTEHLLEFEKLESVELCHDLAQFHRGDQLSGETGRSVASGRFRNEEFGEYELHVMEELHDYVVARDSAGVLVFNYESDETTETLYTYLFENLSDGKAA